MVVFVIRIKEENIIPDAVEKLDELITCEQKKIDHLMEIREYPSKYSDYYESLATSNINVSVEHDIEKAYEQLAIYKIRKLMGF